MLITIKLYGNLKRHMPNKKEIATAELPPGTTIGALLTRLGVADSDVWMSALNDSVVPESTELHDGDVLEVFEPIGGGQGTNQKHALSAAEGAKVKRQRAKRKPKQTPAKQR